MFSGTDITMDAGTDGYIIATGAFLNNGAELRPGATGYSTTSGAPTSVGTGGKNCIILNPNAGSLQYVQLTQGADGQYLWLHNEGAASNDLQITNTNATTAAATNLYLAPGESALVRYSGTKGFRYSPF
jgi:hypothetical protein